MEGGLACFTRPSGRRSEFASALLLCSHSSVSGGRRFPTTHTQAHMQTTLVTATAPGARSKTTLYVGGLADGVSEAVLHAVVVPFGEVKVSF